MDKRKISKPREFPSLLSPAANHEPYWIAVAHLNLQRKPVTSRQIPRKRSAKRCGANSHMDSFVNPARASSLVDCVRPSHFIKVCGAGDSAPRPAAHGPGRKQVHAAAEVGGGHVMSGIRPGRSNERINPGPARHWHTSDCGQPEPEAR
jgi:hypothetical protein